MLSPSLIKSSGTIVTSWILALLCAHQPTAFIHSRGALYPKYQLFPCFTKCTSGSRFFSLFFVENGANNMKGELYLKDRYIKKITLYNVIHIIFALSFFIFALLFFAGILSGDFFIDKALNLIILVSSGIIMGVIKIKVTHLKHQRYHYLVDNESIPDSKGK